MRSTAAAFSIVRGIRGSAHLFQVYVESQRLGFVRVGAGPGAEYAVAAHGGLIGALLAWWIGSARKKSEQRRIEQNQSKTLDQMLREHKASHVILLSDISEVSLEPGGWAMKKGTVIWRFRVRGEKKQTLCAFPKIDDIAAALDVLPKLFPSMRIDVQLDQRSGKYLKKTPHPTVR